ncbi:response regulator [Sphingopyxis sp. XHP0097]|uniref:Response regulator n=1 Tax=Sphingopyxis jiangsuensis TaxID=2871171 RepID=A0ABS7MBT3_9SPHN|nr:response regulator [Sphingopyxis jiangsuensis]MBY4636492.1 response regulator [Sphingopyxis jiangsuensis]
MPPTRSILLVDDDPALCEAIAFALETEDYSVRAYGSGEAVLGEAARLQYDCAVIDYRLPGVDGLALLARLRTRGLRCPVIIITSNPSARMRHQAENAGACLVEKPLLRDSLIDAIDALVASPGKDGP